MVWLRDMMIWIVCIIGVVALLSLLLRYIVPKMKEVFGISDEVFNFFIAALRIVIWVIVICAIIYFVFSLIFCLMPGLPVGRR